jgi:hypothetical protein
MTRALRLELWGQEIKIGRISVMNDQLSEARAMMTRASRASPVPDGASANERSKSRIGPQKVTLRPSVGVDDQFLFRKELQRAVALGIDGIAKIAVRGGKDGNDDAAFMIVGRFFNPFANLKFGHRELLSESFGAIIRPNWLTDLKHVRRGFDACSNGRRT